MLDKPKTKKKEKITIDKEDWDLLIKSYTGLTKDMKFVKEELQKRDKVEVVPQPQQKVGAYKDSVFMCATIHFGAPKDIQEVAQQKVALEEFKIKLEKLMREHKIGQVTAQILKKL